MDAWERMFRDEEEALSFFLHEEFRGVSEMNASRNIRLGFVKVTLLGGSKLICYIREYDPATLEARCKANHGLIQVRWNGDSWIEVQAQAS